jgi:transmembrane sensor
VTVLGTTFGVSSAGRQSEVVLVSGVVEVAPRTGGAPVRLAPGESSVIDARQGASPAAPADLDEALGWTGDIFLRAEPLASAASRLGAAFGVSVEVDSSLATEAVSGRFGREDGVDAALRALALAIDGRVERTAAGYRIVRAAD